MAIPETDLRINKHPFDNPVPRYLAAGFLAIILHLVFLLFIESPDSDNAVAANVKHVSLLPLDTKLPSEKKLLQWMNIMDPSCVVKPDRVRGFSFVPEMKKPDDMEVTVNKHFSMAQKGIFLPIPAPVESYRDKIQRIWNYTPAPVRKPSFVISRHTEKDFPLWVREDGFVLPQLFIDHDQVRKILKQKGILLKETVLCAESFRPGFFPRIKIDVSCGDKELDLLALKTLGIKGRHLFDSQKGMEFPGYIAVKWQMSDK